LYGVSVGLIKAKAVIAAKTPQIAALETSRGKDGVI
jgi:hypothetical protein